MLHFIRPTQPVSTQLNVIQSARSLKVVISSEEKKNHSLFVCAATTAPLALTLSLFIPTAAQHTTSPGLLQVERNLPIAPPFWLSPKIPPLHKMPASGTNSSSATPAGWTPAMAAFIQKLLRNGEDTKSAIILLETEWPSMEGKVGLGWVEGLRK